MPAVSRASRASTWPVWSGATRCPPITWEATEALEEGVAFHNSLGPDGDPRGRAARSPAWPSAPAPASSTRAGRFSPQFDDSQTTQLAADTVIVAIGQGVDAVSMSPVVTGPGGRIVADPETLATNVPGVFAGGDAVLGPASVVDAMAHGPSRPRRRFTATCAGETSQTAPLPSDRARRSHRIRTPTAPRSSATMPMPQAPVEGALQRFARDRPRLLGGGGDRRGAALPELRPVLRVPALREGMRSGRDRPRSCSRETEVLQVGAVILTPGFEEIQASLRGEYGHGRYANVLSVVQFERMLSAVRPDRGHVQRPSDGGAGASGSPSSSASARATAPAATAIARPSAACRRPRRRSSPWSTRPDLEIAIFCIDIRAFGKEFDRYVDRAKRRARRALRPRHAVARRRDAGHEEPARPLLRRAGRGAARGVRPGRALASGMQARRERCARLAERLGIELQRVRLLRDGPAGARGHVPPGHLRRRRVPGAEGHPRDGGAGERGRGVRDGAARPRRAAR